MDEFSVNPDQLASDEASCSGFSQFSKVFCIMKKSYISSNMFYSAYFRVIDMKWMEDFYIWPYQAI